jgi:hypothetical protein
VKHLNMCVVFMQSGEPIGVGFTPVKPGDDQMGSSKEESSELKRSKRKLEMCDD